MQRTPFDDDRRLLLHQLRALERSAQQKNQALYLADEFGILRLAIERIAERGTPSEVARVREDLADLQGTIAELPWKFASDPER